MGCDIHLYVERKVNGKWVSADKWTPNKYAADEGEPPVCVGYEDRFYTGRNYDLFAILANVRNGRGFAPIALPKGIPSDVTPEVKAESDRWDGDGHSHSWFTLAELKAYDWVNPKTKHFGWVNPVEFMIFEKNGKPQSWGGGVSGQTVRHISNEEMREHIKSLQLTSDTSREEFNRDTLSYYTQVSWTETYHTSVKPFVDETIPKLEAMSYGKPDNIRIVFWFDN